MSTPIFRFEHLDIEDFFWNWLGLGQSTPIFFRPSTLEHFQIALHTRTSKSEQQSNSTDSTVSFGFLKTPTSNSFGIRTNRSDQSFGIRTNRSEFGPIVRTNRSEFGPIVRNSDQSFGPIVRNSDQSFGIRTNHSDQSFGIRTSQSKFEPIIIYPFRPNFYPNLDLFSSILPISSGWTLIKLLLWIHLSTKNIDFFYSRTFQHLFRRFDVTLHSPLQIRLAR